jgi:tripartite ATP-independent transporter DctP family solute receptor
MNMRLILVVILAMGLVVLNTNYVQSKEILNLKLGHAQNADTAFHEVALKLASRINKYTDGKISVSVYPASQLGNERDLVEGLRLGTVQLFMGNMASVTQFVPELNVLMLPYITRGYEHSIRAWDTIIAPKLGGKMGNAGFHTIGVFIGSTRGIEAKKPIMSLSDLKGMRIRTMESKISIDTYRALGAIPTPIPFGEIMSALQAGLVDAVDIGILAFFTQKHLQVAPFYAELNMVSTNLFLISQSVWKGLPEELKTAVEKAGDESAKEYAIMFDKDIKKNELLARQSKFPFAYTFPDVTEFREAVKPVYAKNEKEIGKELIQSILNLK